MPEQGKLGSGGFLATGMAFAAGYMVGRTRKGKLAAGLALAVGARGLGGSLGGNLGGNLGGKSGLLLGGVTKVLGNAVGKALEEAAGSVKEAGRVALNSRLESVADSLRERTDAMQQRSGQSPNGGQAPRGQTQEPEGEEPEPEEPEAEEPVAEQPEEEEQEAEQPRAAKRSGPQVRRRPPSRQAQAGQRGGR